ncbi:MAG: methyltransferase domain-containing protein [Thermodesulfovibrionales bacterium]
MIRPNKNKEIINLWAGDPIYRGFFLCYPANNKDRYNKKFLVKSVIEGEVLRAKLLEEKPHYCTATLLDIVTPSPHRVKPPCQYYHQCGGCHYQHIQYNEQVYIKQKILKDCLKRIAKINVDLAPPIIGKEWRYRYRGSFKAHGKAIGFYREGTRDLISVDRCLLMNDGINTALRTVNDIIPNDYEGEIIIIGSKDLAVLFKPQKPLRVKMNLDTLADRGINASLSHQQKTPNDNPHRICLNFNNMNYFISPFSFFQANWALNLEVINTIKSTVELDKKIVCDLYAGSGNFSIAISDKASFVYGFEENPHAVSDAINNATVNMINNCKFYCKRAEDIDIRDVIDVMIVNPPRLGMSKSAMQRLLKMMPKTIVYMSCDPSTFSRDIKRLIMNYQIQSIRLIDFFPQTYHIETLAILEGLR